MNATRIDGRRWASVEAATPTMSGYYRVCSQDEPVEEGFVAGAWDELRNLKFFGSVYEGPGSEGRVLDEAPKF